MPWEWLLLRHVSDLLMDICILPFGDGLNPRKNGADLGMVSAIGWILQQRYQALVRPLHHWAWRKRVLARLLLQGVLLWKFQGMSKHVGTCLTHQKRKVQLAQPPGIYHQTLGKKWMDAVLIASARRNQRQTMTRKIRFWSTWCPWHHLPSRFRIQRTCSWKIWKICQGKCPLPRSRWDLILPNFWGMDPLGGLFLSCWPPILSGLRSRVLLAQWSLRSWSYHVISI